MNKLKLQELKKQNEQYIEDSEAYSPLQVKQLLTNYKKVVDALKFECGNRCADQNPCNAKETLRELGEVE